MGTAGRRKSASPPTPAPSSLLAGSHSQASRVWEVECVPVLRRQLPPPRTPLWGRQTGGQEDWRDRRHHNTCLAALHFSSLCFLPCLAENTDTFGTGFYIYIASKRKEHLNILFLLLTLLFPPSYHACPPMRQACFCCTLPSLP